MTPIEKKAHLITILGIDGAGKSTQARYLAEWLEKKGYPVTLHPNESLLPVRTILNEISREQGYEDHLAMLGPDTARLNSAVIKFTAMIKARQALETAGRFVIMDRYTYCQYAAIRLFRGSNEWLLRRMFSIFPTPDIAFFLDTSAEQAKQRIERRGIDSETLSFLTGFAKAYQDLPEAKDFVMVNGDQPAEQVAEQIRAHMMQQFPELAADHKVPAAGDIPTGHGKPF